MKKIGSLGIFLLFFLLTFTSCLDDNDKEATFPYVALRSFSISDIYTSSITQNSKGEDTTIVRVTVGSNYTFSVNQSTFEVSNSDSLPLATDLTHVKASITSDGVPYVYVDSTESYVLFNSSDSLDYSQPKKILILSTDGQYYREYTVKLNVHKTDPDSFSWSLVEGCPSAGLASLKALSARDSLFLMGQDQTGKLWLTSTPLYSTAQWSAKSEISGLPSATQLSSVAFFNDAFYTVSQNKLFRSSNGLHWSLLSEEYRYSLLFPSLGNEMWVVANDSLAYTLDGAQFTLTEPLPQNFPDYHLSALYYPLRTNTNIMRYLLIGRSSQSLDADPKIWSRLSTEPQWSSYESSVNDNRRCPSLDAFAVFSYDDRLFLIGGEGEVEGERVAPFSAIYISSDHGITWFKASDEENKLPESLQGKGRPFSVIVDSEQYIWLMTGGEDGACWRGRINRLGFTD